MASRPGSPAPHFAVSSQENGYIPPLRPRRSIVDKLFGSKGNSSHGNHEGHNHHHHHGGHKNTASPMESSTSRPLDMDQHLSYGRLNSSAPISRPRRNVAFGIPSSMTTSSPASSSFVIHSSSSSTPKALAAESEMMALPETPRYRRHASYRNHGHYNRPSGCYHDYKTTTTSTTSAPRDILCIRDGRPIFAGEGRDELCFNAPATDAPKIHDKIHEKEELFKKPFELLKHPSL